MTNLPKAHQQRTLPESDDDQEAKETFTELNQEDRGGILSFMRSLIAGRNDEEGDKKSDTK